MQCAGMALGLTALGEMKPLAKPHWPSVGDGPDPYYAHIGSFSAESCSSTCSSVTDSVLLSELPLGLFFRWSQTITFSSLMNQNKGRPLELFHYKGTLPHLECIELVISSGRDINKAPPCRTALQTQIGISCTLHNTSSHSLSLQNA